MFDEIKLNYEQARAMAKSFHDGSEALKDTMQELQNIANTLEEGALLGRGGVAFVEAIRGRFCPSVAKLAQKFTELEGDVKAAISAMQQADRESAGQFGR